MPDVKISALPSATTPLTGAEVLPVVQSSVTDKVTVANLTAGRAVQASSLALNGATIGANALAITGTATFSSYLSASALAIGGATPGAYTVDISGTFRATGAANAASIALNGATIGTNAFAVTGTSAFGGNLTTTGTIKLFGATSGDVTIRTAAIAGTSTIFQLPATNGTANYALLTDGTGITSWGAVATGTINAGTIGQLTYYSGANALSGTTTGTGVLTALGVNVGSAGAFVVNGGALGTPSSGTLTNCTGLPAGSITGQLALANGGTNANLTASNGGIFYSTASAGAILAGTATAGQILRSGASSAPSWSTATFPSTATGTGTILRADGTNWVATTATYPTTTTINQLLYSSAADTITGLATVNGGILNANSSGVPSLTVTPTLGVAGTSAGTLGLSGLTSGVVTLQTAAAAGTWSLTLPTSGGTSSYALTTDGSGVSSWSQINLASAVTGTLPVGNGGTGLTALGTSVATGLGTAVNTANGFLALNASNNFSATVGTFTCNSSTNFLPQFVMFNYSNDATAGYFIVKKGRAASGAGGAVQVNDTLGTFNFSGLDTGGVSRNATSFSCAVTAVDAVSVTARMTFTTINAAPITFEIGGGAERARIDASGNLLVGTTTTNATKLTVAGPGAFQSPSTKTGNYSLVATDHSLIFNGTGTITLTLQAASSYPGRMLYVKTIAAQAVDSASSNVVPIGSATAGTAILTNTAGKWAILQSDGTNWITMAAG